MRESVAAAAMLLLASFAVAEEDRSPAAGAGEGLRAFDALVESGACGEGGEILGLVGFHGDPRPGRWLVLVRGSGGSAGLRELAFAGGRVTAEREILPLPGQDLPRLPLRRETLKIDSDEALRIATASARDQGVAFERVHFHLRVRDEGVEPVWLVQFLGRGQRPAGQVYLSATTGTVMRVTWSGSGAATSLSLRRG